MLPLLRKSATTIAIVLSAAALSPVLYWMLPESQTAVPEWVYFGALYLITSAWAIWAAVSQRPFLERLAALAACLACFVRTSTGQHSSTPTMPGGGPMFCQL